MLTQDRLLKERRQAFDSELTVTREKLDANRAVVSTVTETFTVRGEYSSGAGTSASPGAPEAEAKKAAREEPFELLQITDHFNYTLEGEETVDGVPCHRIAFTPKPDMPYHSREEKVLNAVAGHLWVSIKDCSLIRNEGALTPSRFRRVDLRQPAGNGIPLRRHAAAEWRLRPGRGAYRYRVKIPFLTLHERDTRRRFNYLPAGAHRAAALRFVMIIGVPKEVKIQEHRVALLPSAVYQLGKHGHRVIVERGAGVDSGYPDHEYEVAGAKLADSHEEPFQAADLIVKVKEPVPSEYPLLAQGKILFTYLHLAATRPLTDALLKSAGRPSPTRRSTRHHRLPLLEPMSEIAGRMSVIVGGHFLAKPHGGKGVLLGGVPGVLPGRVVVLGGGTSGVNAARMAAGLGADITILEVDLERMRFLDITMNGAHTLFSSEAHLIELLPTVDLLIGAVLVPGAKAPKLISREMLRR